MAMFIINNKVYDTSKMVLIGNVRKWYRYRGYLLKQIFGEGMGRTYDCELFRSEKGNWLLMYQGEFGLTGEAITEEEAQQLLKKYDYDAYVKIYGELEEA